MFAFLPILLSAFTYHDSLPPDIIMPNVLDKDNWTVETNTHTVSSIPENAIDNNVRSIWHSQFGAQGLFLPEGQRPYLLFNLSQPETFGSFSMVPRPIIQGNTGSNNGKITEFELYVGNDY